MLIRFLATIALLIIPTLVHGESVTFTPNNAQNAAIIWKVEQINARIRVQNAPNAAWNAANPLQPPRPLTSPYTFNQYLVEAIARMIESDVAEWRNTIPTTAAKRFQTMAPAERAALCAQLGIAACPQ